MFEYWSTFLDEVIAIDNIQPAVGNTHLRFATSDIFMGLPGGAGINTPSEGDLHKVRSQVSSDRHIGHLTFSRITHALHHNIIWYSKYSKSSHCTALCYFNQNISLFYI